MEAMNDDLDSPKALSIVWEIARKENKSKKYAELIGEMDEILAIDISIDKIKEREKKKELTLEESIDDNIKKLIQEREEARAKKDWTTADRIRDELEKQGIRLKDTKEGVKIEKIVN